jgi:CBS domain-containing protein
MSIDPIDTDRLDEMPVPGHRSPGLPEIADPNFTAASPRAKDHTDTGVTRMDTGRNFDNRKSQAGRSGNPSCVRDVMTADIEVCTPQTELYYVARMMAERDVGAIPVVESTDSMKPVGIITDRDIVIRAIAKRQDPDGLRCADCMSTDLLTVAPDMSLDECLNRMEERQVRRVVVVDESGRCCGIVAQADIARMAPANETAELVRDISQPDEDQQSMGGGHAAYH